MSKTQFKTLMFAGNYVDANRLEKGIYMCSKPFIYSSDATIQSLIYRAEGLADMLGQRFLGEEYIENLKKCELVPIRIILNEGGEK